MWKMKPVQPMLINSITILIGTVLIALYITPRIEFEFITVVIGVGTGLVSASLINILFEMRTRNKVIEMTTSATMENWPSVNRIRGKQKVNITFKKAGEKIHVTTRHNFTYEGRGRFAHDESLAIESDYRGILYPEQEDFADVDPPCYFREVLVDDKVIASWENPDERKRLCTITRGKLRCVTPFIMPPHGGSVGLEFLIHSEYELNDRLTWTFQEIAESADIRIRVDPNCHDMFFYFRVNHPLTEGIVKDNHDRIPTSSRTGKIEIESLSSLSSKDYFHYNKKILPNQGFEIAWSDRDNYL